MIWHNQCHIGDCREVLKSMAEDGVRVQMCVTSPPYWGLRDYGTASWEGGDKECDHSDVSPHVSEKTRKERGGGISSWTIRDVTTNQGGNCKCGARRIDSQLGLEATPEEYIANMVEVFQLVREVLADDGTLWVNMGDSYAGSTMTGGNNGINASGGENGFKQQRQFNKPAQLSGLKPKDLCGMPWRLAFALQANGWYLRSDIIWHKSNPMPESVTDRPTKSHEYLFLLSKKPSYYYDAEAVKEPVSEKSNFERFTPVARPCNRGDATNDMTTRARLGGWSAGSPTGRNRRTVWTIATAPFKDAHFATFPPKLVEPCIMAGSRPGAVVLDPFFGSGTVGQVAESLGRSWIGIELNPNYVEMSKARTAQIGMAL